MSILYCFNTHQTLYRPNRHDYFSSPSSSAAQRTSILQYKATADCSRPSLQLLAPWRQARTSLSGTASTVTAVDQVCSSLDKQKLPLHGTKSTATAVDQVCSSRAIQEPLPRAPSHPILCGLYTPSNPILCVANQAHHPQLHCSTIRAYNCNPVSPACFQKQHPTQHLAHLTLQSHLKTIF